MPAISEAASAHGAIVLAAGASTRLGRAKQLVEIDGEPLLRRVARFALATRPRDCVVVLGHDAARIGSGARRHSTCARSAITDADTGMAASLRAGIGALRSRLRGRADRVDRSARARPEVIFARCARPGAPRQHVRSRARMPACSACRHCCRASGSARSRCCAATSARAQCCARARARSLRSPLPNLRGIWTARRISLRCDRLRHVFSVALGEKTRIRSVGLVRVPDRVQRVEFDLRCARRRGCRSRKPRADLPRAGRGRTLPRCRFR